eukprot:7590326-Pyramimonas_sp.AAC.1
MDSPHSRAYFSRFYAYVTHILRISYAYLVHSYAYLTRLLHVDYAYLTRLSRALTRSSGIGEWRRRQSAVSHSRVAPKVTKRLGRLGRQGFRC